jgi:hypothetical protein
VRRADTCLRPIQPTHVRGQLATAYKQVREIVRLSDGFDPIQIAPQEFFF